MEQLHYIFDNNNEKGKSIVIFYLLRNNYEKNQIKEEFKISDEKFNEYLNVKSDYEIRRHLESNQLNIWHLYCQSWVFLNNKSHIFDFFKS